MLTRMAIGFLRILTSVLAFVGLAGRLLAENRKAFDEKPLEWKLTLDGPMNTIAGLTDFGREINHAYGITTWVVSSIFILVAIPIIYVLWRYKTKVQDFTTVKPPKQTHGHPLLEVIWTAVPVILLIIIWIPTYQAIWGQHDGIERAKNDPQAVKIEVIGHQWWWEFRYKDLPGLDGEVVTANELRLPENTAILFDITSDDVIHSFWIPNFGGKIDAMPGDDHRNHLYFTTPALTEQGHEKGGDYYQGQCVELCGSSHALMRFSAVVQTHENFIKWAKAVHTPPNVQTSLEKKGEEIFNRCIACHTIYGTTSASIPGKKLGPNLTDFGIRLTLGAGTRANTVENLKQWINHPETIKPGALMPGQALSDDELDAVIAYVRNTTIKEF